MIYLFLGMRLSRHLLTIETWLETCLNGVVGDSGTSTGTSSSLLLLSSKGSNQIKLVLILKKYE